MTEKRYKYVYAMLIIGIVCFINNRVKLKVILFLKFSVGSEIKS